MKYAQPLKTPLTTVNSFLTQQYDDIVLMSKKICKSHHEYEEVAHYVISDFIEHPRAQEFVNAGVAMRFISGMIHRSFHSSTSRYHAIYRQKGKMHTISTTDIGKLNFWNIEYDHEIDFITEAIDGILEEMMIDTNELWYMATLFRLYLDEQNYSQISRNTGIPRISISNAVQECKEYVKEKLKERGIRYE